MQSPGGSSFTLHFDNGGDRTPDVFAPLLFPLVRPLPHGRRGGDGVDGNHFIEAVRYRGGSFVPVQNSCVLGHFSSPPGRVDNSFYRVRLITAVVGVTEGSD